MNLFVTQVAPLEIILRAGSIYLLLLVGLRLIGKRHIGQLSPYDLVLLLLISNAVQNAMTGPDTSLTGGILAAGTLLTLSVLTGYLIRHNRWLSRCLEGTETLLIYEGRVIEDKLRRENISMTELIQALREHGVTEPSEVYLAVLEVDGSISVVRNADVPHEHRTRRHFRHLKRPAE